MAPYGNPRVRRRNQRRAWRGASTGRHPQPVAVTYGQRLRDADWAAAQASDDAAWLRYLNVPRGATILLPITNRNED